MEAKFKQFEYVEVDGHIAGYGDMLGWIISVEYVPMLEQYFYNVRVYSDYIDKIYIAEKWIRKTEQKKQNVDF